MKAMMYRIIPTLFLSLFLIWSCSDDTTVDPDCTVGAACDDNNAITTNDVFDANCDCAGTAICTVGAACDDGDANTTNDVYDSNCDCAGTPLCTVGASCDDGNAETASDTFNIDCVCVGTCIDLNMPCDDGNANTYNDRYNANCDCEGDTYGTFTDPRDSKTYSTITLDTENGRVVQTWMAENLDFTPSTSGWWCYDDDQNNCDTYGKLYSQEVAFTVCPDGWHLPTEAEWLILVDYLGGASVAGGAMKSTTGWNAPNTGATNSSGFSALPGGVVFPGDDFRYIGDEADFWTADTVNSNFIYNASAEFYYGISNSSATEIGLSVRCVED